MPNCNISNGGKSITSWFSLFVNSGVTPEFYEIITHHKTNVVPNNYELSNEQRQKVIASAYGDGSLKLGSKASRRPRIVWNMGNKDHALYKKDHFKFVGATYKEGVNPGFGVEWHTVVTKSHYCLLDVYERVNVGGVKVLDVGLIRELGDIGWAWWYGDDGHLDKRRGLAFLHTESFGARDVADITKCINDYLGFDGSRVCSYVGGAKKRRMYCVRFTKEGTEEFIKRVRPYMANGVQYKTVLSD